jgi:hypothetical protein
LAQTGHFSKWVLSLAGGQILVGDSETSTLR